MLGLTTFVLNPRNSFFYKFSMFSLQKKTIKIKKLSINKSKGHHLVCGVRRIGSSRRMHALKIEVAQQRIHEETSAAHGYHQRHHDAEVPHAHATVVHDLHTRRDWDRRRNKNGQSNRADAASYKVRCRSG